MGACFQIVRGRPSLSLSAQTCTWLSNKTHVRMLAYLSAHVGKDGITLFDLHQADARTEDIQTARQHSRVNGMTLSEPLAIHPELYPRMSVP